ncbi:MAG: PEGA domain-containing protein [Polyangiales bacterium]
MVLSRFCRTGLALLLSLTTFIASAQTPSDPKVLAKEHFERGIALFDEEFWDAALVEFAQSSALYPTRNATKNAALCLRMLHRYDEALDMYESLLRDFPDLPPEVKALAEKEIKSLQPLVGSIELRSGEAGSTIVVDSRTRGTLPSKPIRASAGTHTIRVLKDGFIPFETEVDVTGAKTIVVDVKMQPLVKSGRLRVVEASGKAAELFVDGVVVGKTPWEGTLPIGDHTVFLDGGGKLGTQPARAPVTLGQLTPLTVALEELDARIRVEPDPNVANVAVDGVVVGRGPWDGKLRAGPHRIEVSAEGYLGAMRDVTLGNGERQVIAIALERDPAASLTFREAEAARQAWLARRGSTFSFELRGFGNVLLLPHSQEIAGYIVDGQSAALGHYHADNRAPTDYFGGGGLGGVGVRIAYLFLALPDPAVGHNWSGFRIGTGIDASFGYFFDKGEHVETTDTSTASKTETTVHYEGGAWGTGWLFNVPLTLGYQLGLGSYKGNGWAGIALGVAYTPSLSARWTGNFGTKTSFNPAGFEVSVDFLEKPLDSKHIQSNPRVFVYVLPPLRDLPLVLTIGGGAMWY